MLFFVRKIQITKGIKDLCLLTDTPYFGHKEFDTNVDLGKVIIFL